MTDAVKGTRLLCAGAVWLLGLSLPLLGRLNAASELGSGEGQPFLQSFSPSDYHASEQCWAMVQDTGGVLYIGNEGTVLEYDGAAWRKIPTGASGSVFGLAYEAATDSLFVGGTDQVGLIKRTPGGERVYQSLLDQLPAEARDVGEIRRVCVSPDGVFFVGGDRVMRWRDHRFTVWKIPTKIRLQSGWAAGQLFLQNTEIGLLRFDKDAFVPASSDPIFHQASVLWMTTGPNEAVFMGTRKDGLFVFRDGVAKPFGGELNGFFKEKGIIRLLCLSDGSLAVGTSSAGVVILDKEGRFRNRIDESSGLHPGSVLNLFEDTEGGLWVGLQYGVARAEVNSPLSILRGEPGKVVPLLSDAATFHGTHFLSSFSGMYRIVPPDLAKATGAHLEPLPGYAGLFTGLCTVENGVLAAGEQGVICIDSAGQTTAVYSASMVNSIWRSRLHPERVFLGLNGKVGA